MFTDINNEYKNQMSELVERLCLAIILQYIEETRVKDIEGFKEVIVDTMNYGTFFHKYVIMVVSDPRIHFNLKVDMIYHTMKMLERYNLFDLR